MNIPTVLYLTQNMNKLEKLDEAICEIVKLLLQRIEALETKVELMEAEINDIQESNDK